MDLLLELTINNLKLNKKRSIATIIGIMLSVALIFTVLSGVSSFRVTMKNNTLLEEGDYHVSTHEQELFQKIKSHKNYDSSYEVNLLGYTDLDKTNYSKQYLLFKSIDKNALEKNKIELVEGRLPNNNTEIIVNKASSAYFEKGLEINKSYKFPIMSIKEIIDEEGNANIEKNNIGEKTYKLVGYYSQINDTIESYMDPGFVALSLKEDNEFAIESNIFFKLKNTRQLKGTIAELFPEDSQINTHDSLLRLDGVGLSDNTMNVLYGIAAIIIAMIVFTSVSVIRNSFSISIVEKTKQYGILKSLGATDKQIKKDIYFEAFSLGAIGIALGLLLGFVATKILIFTINKIGKNRLFMGDITFEASFSFIGIALAIGLALLTILLSSMRVVRRVKNISAIEAIRGSKDINIKDKDIKTPAYIDSLFGFAGLVSYKNLKRNSKKYRTTLLSLITSVAIFISAFYIVDALKDSLALQFQEEAIKVLKPTIEKEKKQIIKSIAHERFIGDFNWEKEVYINLIKNAIEHGEDNLVTIEARDTNSYLEVSVINKGGNFSKQDQFRIFDRFYKISKSENNFGIGLNLCKLIVEEDNGKISLDFKDGYTKFVIKYFKSVFTK